MVIMGILKLSPKLVWDVALELDANAHWTATKGIPDYEAVQLRLKSGNCEYVIKQIFVHQSIAPSLVRSS
jgi:hypothetical protein